MHTVVAQRIHAFVKLGESLRRIADVLSEENHPEVLSVGERHLFDESLKSEQLNSWFDRREIARTFRALAFMLGKDALHEWVGRYPAFSKGLPREKKVAVIMAGNIPLVGFHDFLCVVLSGHGFTGKLSSQDGLLPPALSELLVSYLPELQSRIRFTNNDVAEADAIIATGSDNTARFFEYRYADKPRIIRKNRNSAAVITGRETMEQLQSLGEDVFAYYGRGCRSVSLLMLPASYDIQRLKQAWSPCSHVLMNKKYGNNLRYNRAFYNAAGRPFHDLSGCLLVNDGRPDSPVSVLHASHYKDIAEAEARLHLMQSSLQCVVCAEDINAGEVPVCKPGQSQYPRVSDYADGTDTMLFLSGL